MYQNIQFITYHDWFCLTETSVRPGYNKVPCSLFHSLRQKLLIDLNTLGAKVNRFQVTILKCFVICHVTS
jgi:hypothetical protein